MLTLRSLEPIESPGPAQRVVRARRQHWAEFSAVLCVVVCLGSGPSSAAADLAVELCAAELPAGVVRVQTQQAVPQVTYARNAREILDQTGVRQEAVALGLTLTSVSVGMEVVLHRAQSQDGTIGCARPEIDITLSHASMEIMLASEIERDACVSALVLEHEMTHVAIERETLQRAAESLSAQMQTYYRDRILSGDEAQAMARLEHEFDQRWAPVLSALLQASNVRHAEYDARDRYGDKEACRGDLMRIARSIH